MFALLPAKGNGSSIISVYMQTLNIYTLYEKKKEKSIVCR